MNFYLYDRYRKEDIRSAVHVLEKRTTKKDVILLVGSRRAFKYYFDGEAEIVTFSRNETKSTKILEEKLYRINKDFRQVWILISSPWGVDFDNKIIGYYKKQYQYERHFTYNGAEIYMFEPKTNPTMTF